MLQAMGLCTYYVMVLVPKCVVLDIMIIDTTVKIVMYKELRMKGLVGLHVCFDCSFELYQCHMQRISQSTIVNLTKA